MSADAGAVAILDGLTLTQGAHGAERAVRAQVSRLVIAGWTGRDAAAVEKHIAELEAIGVPRPSRTPIFYRVSAGLLTVAPAIQVVGDESSGEVEFVLLDLGGELCVGLGSDHTDRKLEAVDVTLSKQLCAKPIAPAVWRYDDVAPHWDRLVLRSWIAVGAERRLYQEGAVSAMRHPEELMRMYCGGASRLAPGCAMFCGTLAVRGAIEPAAAAFEMELTDPVLGRRIAHRYRIERLPIEK
ncbi:MAG: DUF2848 domain-containing protein [Burkholderiales bacterium]|nr:DUF2848 domain-containing protein [Burkholderiales bacterium]